MRKWKVSILPVKFKKKRFKPEVVLKRIASIRTVSSTGECSFASFELHDALPALQSMLEFPAIADEMDKSTIVLHAVASIKGELTRDTFLGAVNFQLSKLIAIKEEKYCVLTSISLQSESLPRSIVVEGAKISFCKSGYQKRFIQARHDAIKEQRPPINDSGREYCRVVVTVHAKSANIAVTKALRALDLLRAALCMSLNPAMRLASSSWVPTNVVRLGSIHTVHHFKGEVATGTIWFEPNYAPTSPHRFAGGWTFQQAVARYFKPLRKCRYRGALMDALLRHVRALDEPNPSVAFIGAWGAVEALATPDVGKYDILVKRCSFLFQDGEYHSQLLEHLREYRNRSVHAGDESDKARIHCYQIQLYFRALIDFHLVNISEFVSLADANSFLDLPASREKLIQSQQRIKKALRFVQVPPND